MNTVKKCTVVALAMLGTIAAAVAQTPAVAQAPTVIAQAGKQTITDSELQGLLKDAAPEVKARLLADRALLEEVVRARLAEKVLYDQAKAVDWHQRPEVQAALAQLQRQVVSQSYLEAQTEVPADFPSESMIQSVYDKEKANLVLGKRLKLAQIVLATQSESAKSTLARAKELVAKARAPGASFADLAVGNSDDKATAAKGGEVGVVMESQLQPPIRDALAKLKTGEVSDPIEAAGGVLIFKVLELIPPATAPLATVHDSLKQSLRQARKKELQAAYLAKLANAQNSQINEIALTNLLGAQKP